MHTNCRRSSERIRCQTTTKTQRALTSGIGQCVGKPISSSLATASRFSLFNSAQTSGSPFITGMPFFETVYLTLAAVKPSDVKQPVLETSHFLLIDVVKFVSMVITFLGSQLVILLKRIFQPSCAVRKRDQSW